MKIFSSMIRVAAYISLITILVVSVLLRQKVVSSERSAISTSYILEIDKHGKPVTAREVKGGTFEMKEKFTVIPVGESKFEGYVTRKVASGLKEGQPVNMVNGDNGIRGEVSFVSQKVDMMSGLYRVEVEFKKPITHKKKKLMIEATIGEKKDIIEVSNDVLFVEDDEFYLWKIDDGKVRRIKVKLTARSGYSSIIDSGLKKGDILVITGQTHLEEGDRVRIVNDKNDHFKEN